ncbi:FKBP-type peptidyl-prolyl cis-trans isomerase [Spirosoma gilvum]
MSLLALVAMASCSDSSVDPTTTSNLEVIQSYMDTQPLSFTATGSGLYFVTTKASSSTVVPAFGQELELTYTLSVLTRSTSNTNVIVAQAVDSAYATTSTFFPFFSGSLKAGLQEGLLKMHEGESAAMLMPASLAFGSVGSEDKKVAANSAVRYDVTLVRARTEEQQITDYITANKLIVDTTTTNKVRVIRTVKNPTGVAVAGKTVITTTTVVRQLRAKTAVDFDTTGANVKNLAGYIEGVNQLRVGETATLIFPSSAGYKDAGTKTATTNDKGNYLYRVAPYTPLIYTVTVVSAR